MNTKAAFQAIAFAAFGWIDAASYESWRDMRRSVRYHQFRAHAKLPEVSLASLVAELAREHRQSQFVLPPVTLQEGAFGDPHNAFYPGLAAVTAALAPKTIVEVGTYFGVGTLTLAKNAPHARIVTIDLPDTDPTVGMTLGPEDRGHVQRSRGKVGSAFHDTVEASRIAQMLQDSTSLKFTQIVGEADLVLIDGGHAYNVVAADSHNALSVLSPNGAILWDDYAYFYPDVVSYLDRLSADIPLRRIAGTNLVVFHHRWSPPPGSVPRMSLSSMVKRRQSRPAERFLV
jgi:predicted O-methyltransferase YrrM